MHYPHHIRYITLLVSSSFLFSLFIMVLVSTSTVSAQLKLGASPAASSISSKPDLPGPYTDTTLTLEAYSFDPNRANLSWYVNGQLKEQGVGLKTISVKTGPAGSSMTIQVVAVPINGIQVVVTRIIRPAYVAITWEAQTYTPPFYRGKAMASPQADITYVAMPFFVDSNGKQIDPSKLVYTWKRRYNVDAAASGYGKRVYTPPQDLRNADIFLDVATVDKTITASTHVSTPRIQPIVEAYVLNPLFGIKYENAIGQKYTLSGQESTIVAEPYFFSIPSRESGAIAYDWTIDGTKSGARSSIVLRSTGTGAGTARITLVLRHLNDVLQTVRKVFDVAYGTTETSGFGTTATPNNQQQSTYAPF